MRSGVVPVLRADKVALRLVRQVRDALQGALPDTRCVLFAVTAPIREPAQTANALIAALRDWTAPGIPPGPYRRTMHGNGIAVRVIAPLSPWPARIFGFVHNPEPPPDALLDCAHAILAGTRASTTAAGTLGARDAAALQRLCARLLEADA